MLSSTTLMILCSLPAAGALPISCVPARSGRLHRAATLLVMLTVLALAAAVFVRFDGASPSLSIDLPWIESLGIRFHLAVDGLNVYLLLLTALLFPVVLVCSWGSAMTERPLFLALALLLEAGLLATFLAQDLALLFVFWEAVLIPMALLLLVFGGERRVAAARVFFLYTLAGSVLLLAAVLLLGSVALQQTGAWSFDFAVLGGLRLDYATELFVFAAVVLACAIKCPLVPFHSWLPLAYAEAPAAGTALMAGALSKMGAFLLLKMALPLCPRAATEFGPWLVALAVASILYGAVLALRQDDPKLLIAYSSLSHMGYVVLGVFALEQAALHGALLQILSHGVAAAGLFLLLGLLEERLGLDWRQVGGLAASAPKLAVVLMLLVLTSIALPLTSGFAAEFMILLGAFRRGVALWLDGGGILMLCAPVVAVTGMVIGAGYMLRFARTVLFGPATVPCPDLRLREGLALLPLLLLILLLGISPALVTDKAQDAVAAVAGTVERGNAHGR